MLGPEPVRKAADSSPLLRGGVQFEDKVLQAGNNMY